MAAEGLDRPLTLLLQACLLPEDAARAAWQTWLALRPFEDVSGAEVRLLAPLSARLAVLDPGSPLLPRIQGIARARWTMAQPVLREAGAAIGALAEAGVHPMPFGSAATHAEGFAADARREIGAVDLLVPAAALPRAAARLAQEGWSAADGSSGAFLARAAAARRRVRLLRGEHGDIALWTVPFAACRNDRAALAALWRDAVPAVLGGRSVRVPQPTDAVLIALVHEDPGGGWVLDAARRATRQTVDWAALVAAARAWGVSALVEGRLDVLVRDFGLALDPAVRRRLAADRPTLVERLRAVAPRRIRRLLGRGYILPPDDAPGVPAHRARRSAVPAADHAFALLRRLPPGQGRLLLAFPAAAMGRPFRIEASRDGQPVALIRGRVRAPVHALAWPDPSTLDLEARPQRVDRAGFGQAPAPVGEAVPFHAWRG